MQNGVFVRHRSLDGPPKQAQVTINATPEQLAAVAPSAHSWLAVDVMPEQPFFVDLALVDKAYRIPAFVFWLATDDHWEPAWGERIAHMPDGDATAVAIVFWFNARKMLAEDPESLGFLLDNAVKARRPGTALRAIESSGDVVAYMAALVVDEMAAIYSHTVSMAQLMRTATVAHVETVLQSLTPSDIVWLARTMRRMPTNAMVLFSESRVAQIRGRPAVQRARDGAGADCVHREARGRSQ